MKIFKNKFLLSFLFIAIIKLHLSSQSISNYASVRNTGVTYSSINNSGFGFANWRNITSFTQDDNRSDFTDIGFDFWYNGVRYNQFSASTNGFIDFSNSTDDGGPVGDDFGFNNAAFTNANIPNATLPAIAPFYDDLTAQGGTNPLGNSIKYLLTGAAPNRTLTIEWINMAVYLNTSPSLNFQVQLVETSGKIFVNYGTMNTGTHLFSYSMGLNGQILSAIPTPAQLKMLQTVNTNVLNNTVQNNLSAMPAANSQYVFTPPVPSLPSGAIAFTGITSSGMTLNWTNWATNEVGYAIYNSTDGINYTFVNQTAANAVSSAITGLLPGVTYYWKLYAVTEGCLSSPLNGTQATLSGGNKISIASGNWSNSAIWSPPGVPSLGENVTISNGHQIAITSTANCNNLTVGTGGAATLQFSTTTARSMTVNNNITVNTSATFDVNINSNVTHSLTIKGGITNNGNINFATDANSLCNLFVIKNGNITFNGTGLVTRFNLINVSLGGSSNNVLEIASNNFSAANGFLTLNSGTFKLSTINTVNIVPFLATTAISQYSGLWLNSANAIVTTSAGINLSGKLTVSNGTFNVGNQTNEDLLSSGGNIVITNGALNIAGKYYSTGLNNLSYFSISGGTLTVPTLGSTSTTDAPFQIAGLGSQFNMTGGLIVIPQEGGTGAQDLGFTNTGSTSGVVNGGTLQIGSLTSPANQIININSNSSIGGLLINSTNITARIVTNSLSVVNNIRFNSGNLNANNLNILLGGSWQNNGGLFTAGTASVTFNSSNAQSIFKAGGETFNHLVISGSGVKTCSAAVNVFGNITINSGSTFDVSSANHQLSVRGNFNNSGIFNAQNGTVLLNGTTNQSIGGNSTTNFYNLTLNNNAGAILNNNENLIGTLTLSNGAFNTNLKIFTMVSTATATARIAQITGTGDIVGIVRVQRYAPGGSTGWALIGTPISSALSFSDWDDNIFISCPTCPDGNASNFLSIYHYDETAAGSYSDAASYIPISTINDPILQNKGYWVYLGDGLTTTNPITLDVIGTVRKFNQTIPLSVTNNASSADIGWNLIHNPYPSAISWAALKGTTTNIDNAIYAYNADLNGGAGGNATYVNGVSSPAVGSGGIGDVIPMCQAFYVHSTGATALNATEAVKVSGNPTFLKTSSQNNLNLIRLKLKRSNGFEDETVIYTQAGASSNFDSDYDAIKMSGQDPYAPTIFVEKDSTAFQINGVSPIAGTFTTYVKTLTGYSGSYTISATDFTTFPVGTCINLYDRSNQISTDLTQSNYVFNLNDTTSNARFILNITLNPLQIAAQTKQPTCSDINGGAVSAIGLNNGPWNYYWKNANNQIIKTSLNKSTSDTLTGLFDGKVYLDITSINGCDNNQSNYTIIKQIPTYANFLAHDTVFLSESKPIDFTNSSLNNVTNYWDFDDNNATSNLLSPSHLYQSVGLYSVKLKTTSSTNCIDSIIKPIVVLEKPVGVNELSLQKNQLIVKSIGFNHFVIEQVLNNESQVSYQLRDVTGKLLQNSNVLKSTHLYFELNLNDYNSGVYFLNISVDQNKLTVKLPVLH
jgi:hypothetical protein